MSALFNYIITIHNKENLIEDVINSVINCSGKNCNIYPVLDGCTDNSEKILDQLIASNPQTRIVKIIQNDVHEILSINSALRLSIQNIHGFNIILQDDVILQDEKLEEQIIEVYNQIGPKLGLLSFRLGANFNKNYKKKFESDFFVDYIENAYGHGIANAKILYPGEFVFRDVAIKSPVCIPTKLIHDYGLLDENLAPCFHDDTEYSLRLKKSGFRNGVYAVKFQSEIEWGGTRDAKNNKNLVYNQMILRNQNYVYGLYDYFLNSTPKNYEEKIIIQKYYNQENLSLAKMIYENNQTKRKHFEEIKAKQFGVSIFYKFSSRFSNKTIYKISEVMMDLLSRLLRKIEINNSRKKDSKYFLDLNWNDLSNRFLSRNERYSYMHHFFWNLAPFWLKDHRKYFSEEKRGFGEDAFHSMWFFIFKEFRPKNILEVGVYRGQTLSLFMLLSLKFDIKSVVHGISPFSSSGDNVSVYLSDLDYYNDVLENFRYFNLSMPILHRGYSTDISMVNVIDSELWDLIYIDGNHDYEVANADFNNCVKRLNHGGILVIDDSALFTDYMPPCYSTGGHPGPSKIAEEIDPNKFIELFSVGHNRIFKKL